jgi:hypothetical protein
MAVFNVTCIIIFFLKPMALINKPTVIRDGLQMTNTGWHHADMYEVPTEQTNFTHHNMHQNDIVLT